MKNKKIDYTNSIGHQHYDKKFYKKLNKKFLKSLKTINQELNTENNPFHSFSKNFQFNFRIKDLRGFRKFKTVVIIGMGGSILGSEAIYTFLNKKIKKNFLFLDDIDLKKIEEIKNYQNKKVLFIIISKSGNTIETISNLLSLRIIKKNAKNIIIISEKNNSSLFMLSKNLKLKFIEHKNYIGGRYSVLSEVGMLPAYLMGLNIKNFRANLLNHFKASRRNFLKKSTIILSNIINKNKIRNIIFLNYVPELSQFLYWTQQMLAESLGKKGKGFLPLVSSAPKDHHSLLQLYLEGPRDKLFYIFSSNQIDKKKINSKILGNKFGYLNNKSLNKIKTAQKNSFIQVLKKKKIPFREFRIKDQSEKVLGELFSYFMLETALIGKLNNTNPFDQPSVEEVKINTKKKLN